MGHRRSDLDFRLTLRRAGRLYSKPDVPDRLFRVDGRRFQIELWNATKQTRFASTVGVRTTRSH